MVEKKSHGGGGGGGGGDEGKERKGLWSPEEDERLYSRITFHGVSTWSSVAQLAGLRRSGKSCRLRWMNYLRPDLKKEPISKREEETIVSLQRSLGNRWSVIAARMPGRTDNEIKNYWNSRIRKRQNGRAAAAGGGGRHGGCAEQEADPPPAEAFHPLAAPAGDQEEPATAAAPAVPARFPVPISDGGAIDAAPAGTWSNATTTTTTAHEQSAGSDDSEASFGNAATATAAAEDAREQHHYHYYSSDSVDIDMDMIHLLWSDDLDYAAGDLLADAPAAGALDDPWESNLYCADLINFAC